MERLRPAAARSLKRSLRSMMKSVRIIAATLAVASWYVTLMAGTAHAQTHGVSMTVEPWGGYANFAKNVNLDDKSIFGGTLGFYPFRYVGIEGHLGYATPQTFHGFTPYAITPPTPA